MTIIPLDTDKLDSWLRFFDHRAFADNPWWGSCYCTHYHKTKDGGEKQPGMSNREYAMWLIETGNMRGYLACSDKGEVIGWCNANDKTSFQALSSGAAPEGAPRIKSVVCFIIEKAHRRQGIASLLLQRVIADAKQEHYDIIEAYPSLRARTDSGNYRGPMALYLKHGFTREKHGRQTVTRLYL